AVSSAGERSPYTRRVGGSSPSPPTIPHERRSAPHPGHLAAGSMAHESRSHLDAGRRRVRRGPRGRRGRDRPRPRAPHGTRRAPRRRHDPGSLAPAGGRRLPGHGGHERSRQRAAAVRELDCRGLPTLPDAVHARPLHLRRVGRHLPAPGRVRRLPGAARPARARPRSVLSCLLNVGWLVAWHADRIAVSEVVMLALLGTLVAVSVRLDARRAPASRTQRWLVDAPFSVYLGWISVATIANT